LTEGYEIIAYKINKKLCKKNTLFKFNLRFEEMGFKELIN